MTASEEVQGFVVECAGPDGMFAVFEDDGETGYLYVYDPNRENISTHLHVYDRSPAIDVRDSDVRVLWSEDESKCGVVIWGKMRGIIDLRAGREGRARLVSRDAPGITSREWLAGFDL